MKPWGQEWWSLQRPDQPIKGNVLGNQALLSPDPTSLRWLLSGSWARQVIGTRTVGPGMQLSQGLPPRL